MDVCRSRRRRDAHVQRPVAYLASLDVLDAGCGRGLALIELAREFLGYQYLWGGRTPKGFDCSGLVQTVFGLLGVTWDKVQWLAAALTFGLGDFR